MALTIAPLAYLTLHPWFPRAAYYTVMAAALSLAPILLFKYLHHDQPFIFFYDAVDLRVQSIHADEVRRFPIRHECVDFCRRIDA